MRIRYYGHVGKRTGYGRAGEHLCNALMVTPGIDLIVMPFVGFDRAYLDGLPLARCIPGGAGADYEWRSDDVAIVHDLPVDVATKGRRLREGCALSVERERNPEMPLHMIAYTTWEASTMSDEVAHPLGVFDQIWVPCTANASLVNRKLGRDSLAHPVPHPFDATMKIVRPMRDRYTFTWWGALTQRKNPLGVIRAFCHAFTPTDDVELLIHSSDLTRAHAFAMIGMTGLEQAQLPKIRFSSGYKPVHELIGDCYVSASRGEAWNLPAFEAGIIAGAYVIAPLGHGSTDFLLRTSATLIPSTTSPAVVDAAVSDGGAVTVTGAQGLTGRDVWGDPNLIDLSREMRRAFENDVRTLAVGYHAREVYGYEAVGAHMKQLIEQHA